MEIINGSLSMLHVTKIRWSDRGKYRCTRGSRRYKRSQRGHDLSIDDYREAESRLSIQGCYSDAWQKRSDWNCLMNFDWNWLRLVITSLSCRQEHHRRQKAPSFSVCYRPQRFWRHTSMLTSRKHGVVLRLTTNNSRSFSTFPCHPCFSFSSIIQAFLRI